MANEPTDRQTADWWRWPLVPFAAVFGGTVGAFLFGVVQWLGMKLQGGFSEDGWMYRYIVPFLVSCAFGWLYAYCACAVAPRGKLIAGVVMTTLLFLLGLLSIAIVWLSEKYSLGPAIQITIGTVATLIAAVTALVQVHSEQRR